MGFENQFIAKQLSNNDLVARLGKLVQSERRIMHLILECIAEIDLRKLYLEKAYPSLYEFLIKEFGYSPSAALRRIESARLLQEIPEVAPKIESGALNLSQLSQLQQATRQVQKTANRKITLTEKRELLSKMENLTQSKTELILAQELSLPVIAQNKETIHRDESVTLTITFNKVQMALLEQVRDLIAHSVPEKKWAEVITYVARKEVHRRTKINHCSVAQKRSIATSATEVNEEFVPAESVQNNNRTSLEKHLKNETGDSFSEEKDLSKLATSSFLRKATLPTLRKPLASPLKKLILQEEPCCQYKDPTTGKICASTRFLQVDHIQSVSEGGGNERENLQTLCAQHNRFKFSTEKFCKPAK